MNLAEGFLNLWNFFKKKGDSQVNYSACNQEVQIKAPMPGVVSKILISIGDTVSKNDVIFILEAMKMEVKIKTPISGVVQSIGVCVNDKVANAQVMAYIR